ncbi:MAG: hypothetical protein Q4C22_06160 [Bacillota bacterium]|nr:hypothetical protein [Bacillota bacterium]
MWNSTEKTGLKEAGREGVRYVKADPSGNVTLIVADPVPREAQGALARAIMARDPQVEQVGFRETAAAPGAAGRLQMMGGEFCGNGSRSFAAMLALGAGDGGRPSGFREKKKELVIEVSGHPGVLTAEVENLGEPDACTVEVGMPLPLELRHGGGSSLGPYSIAVFEGIVHVLLWGRTPSEEDFPLVRELLEQKEKLRADCWGVMFYDRGRDFMTPLVYVRGPDTKVWEGSCGSGSAAAACALAELEGAEQKSFQIAQPGGVLSVRTEWSRHRKALYLGGTVKLTETGVFPL